jgi:hypothetical protein
MTLTLLLWQFWWWHWIQSRFTKCELCLNPINKFKLTIYHYYYYYYYYYYGYSFIVTFSIIIIIITCVVALVSVTADQWNCSVRFVVGGPSYGLSLSFHLQSIKPLDTDLSLISFRTSYITRFASVMTTNQFERFSKVISVYCENRTKQNYAM